MNKIESIILAISIVGLSVGIFWLHNIVHRS